MLSSIVRHWTGKSATMTNIIRLSKKWPAPLKVPEAFALPRVDYGLVAHMESRLATSIRRIGRQRKFSRVSIAMTRLARDISEKGPIAWLERQAEQRRATSC